MKETANVSADRLWHVFGELYPDIENWSSDVYASRPCDGDGPGSAPFQGRICQTSFGKLTETGTSYDPTARAISYLEKGEDARLR